MKVITIKGKPLRVYAAMERALRLLANNGYCAKMGDFDEGPRRYRANVMTQYRHNREANVFGVSVVPNIPHDGEPPHIRAFFDANPRLKIAIVGDKRRVNLILKKLDAT